MTLASFGAFVHANAPHNATSLYAAAVASVMAFLVIVWGRCIWTGSTSHLDEKWIFQTATAAAPIPTYILLMVIPFDPDLAHSVLDDRIVVAIAGLYGLVETLKDIRSTAAKAHRLKKRGTPPVSAE